MKFRLLVVLLLVASNLFAQPGSWTVINADMKINNSWGIFAETQLRSTNFYNNFFYYEFKGGATYKVSKNLSVSGGLGVYQTYSQTGNFKQPKVNDEFRTWVQMSLSQSVKRLNLDHRYRAEQRWTSTGFRHRFRYRLNATLPLNTKSIQQKTIYLNCSNEVYFTTRSPYFVRNRFILGCGYVFTKMFTFQAGYVHQLDISTTTNTDKNYFQTSFLFDLDWSNKE